MSDFDKALQYVLENEGGLEEDSNDPGGITKNGISFRFLKSIPPERLRLYNIAIYISTDTIRDLTLEQTKALYKGEFWDHAPFQAINNQTNCNFIFDMAVNMGIAPSIKCAQRACWSVLKDKNAVVDDGILGNETIFLINQCSSYLLPAMRSERAGEYRLIIEKNPIDVKYLDGWIKRSYEDPK